jgi:hypothetical protein
MRSPIYNSSSRISSSVSIYGNAKLDTGICYIKSLISVQFRSQNWHAYLGAKVLD